MANGKTIALTRQAFVGKVISLLFNMLSRLVIAFFPRSKCLLISWLQSPSSGPKLALVTGPAGTVCTYARDQRPALEGASQREVQG